MIMNSPSALTPSSCTDMFFFPEEKGLGSRGRGIDRSVHARPQSVHKRPRLSPPSWRPSGRHPCNCRRCWTLLCQKCHQARDVKGMGCVGFAILVTVGARRVRGVRVLSSCFVSCRVVVAFSVKSSYPSCSRRVRVSCPSC